MTSYFSYQEHKTRDRTKDVPEGFVAAEWPAIVVTEHGEDEIEHVVRRLSELVGEKV